MVIENRGSQPPLTNRLIFRRADVPSKKFNPDETHAFRTPGEKTQSERVAGEVATTGRARKARGEPPVWAPKI